MVSQCLLHGNHPRDDLRAQVLSILNYNYRDEVMTEHMYCSGESELAFFDGFDTSLSWQQRRLLVHLGERKRPVEFQGGKDELVLAIKSGFQDIFKQDQQLILQVRPRVQWSIVSVVIEYAY